MYYVTVVSLHVKEMEDIITREIWSKSAYWKKVSPQLRIDH